MIDHGDSRLVFEQQLHLESRIAGRIVLGGFAASATASIAATTGAFTGYVCDYSTISLNTILAAGCRLDIADLFPFDPGGGYLLLSLVSFFGSLIPFVPVPSFLLLATMAVGDQFNLHVLALSSALLAAGAKQIIFYASYGGGRIIGEKSRRRMRPFERLVRRYGAAAAFVAAATPIPDDLVYVPLGLAKYNPMRFFAATLAGKVILHYIIVVVAHFLGLSLVEPFLEDIDDAAAVYAGMIVFGAALTAVVVMLLRLDWARVLGRVAPWTLEEGGGTGGGEEKGGRKGSCGKSGESDGGTGGGEEKGGR